MGNQTVKCGGSKAQLLFEAVGEIVYMADSWVGKGVLLDDAQQVREDLRVGLNDLIQGARCKSIFRPLTKDEVGDGDGHSRFSADHAKYEIGWASDDSHPEVRKVIHDARKDTECHQGEILVNDEPPQVVAVSDLTKHLISNVRKQAGSKQERFVITFVMEVASVTFNRKFSPFHNASYVEDTARKLLVPADGSTDHIVTFATNYGNCVIEKVFCGSLVSFEFSRGASSAGANFEVGHETFTMIASQRGGDPVFPRKDTGAMEIDGIWNGGTISDCLYSKTADIKRWREKTNSKVKPKEHFMDKTQTTVKLKFGDDVFTGELQEYGRLHWSHGETWTRSKEDMVTLEQIEKLLKKWCQSVEIRIKIGGVVRCKLAPYSSVEGITAPPSLASMDGKRLQNLDKACKDLANAKKPPRRLEELQRAVDQAVELNVEDPLLDELREKLDELMSAVSAMDRAGDIESLQHALKASERAGLPEWHRDEHDKALARLKQMQNRWHESRLRDVGEDFDRQCHESRLKAVTDLMSAVIDAHSFDKEGCDQLEAFDLAHQRLENCVKDLTLEAKADKLRSDKAYQYNEVFKNVPQGIGNINFAISTYSEAVEDMGVRAARKTKLESMLKEAFGRAQAAMSADGDSWSEEPFDKLEELLAEASSLVGVEGSSAVTSTAAPDSDAGSIDGDSNVGEGDHSFKADLSLRRLRDKARDLLHRKKSMDEVAVRVESRLRIAMEASACEDLEAALREVDVKRHAGDFLPMAPSAALVDAARRKLMECLQHELGRHLEHDGVDGEENLRAGHAVLKRMDHCRGVCDEEVNSASLRVSGFQRELETRRDRRAAQDEAREKLRHCLDSGDPHHIQEVLQQAQECGIPGGQLLDAEARLRELQDLERQLRSASQGDRVELFNIVEEASRRGLTTPALDDARQKLQSSRTSKLVSAIKSGDYADLKHAIADAKSRPAHEVAEIADVLAQAEELHDSLDIVARDVNAALGSLSYEELRRSVDEAHRLNVMTDDVFKAENLLATMDQALANLRSAASCEPRDLAALQEALHCARQQGLQRHAVYKEVEEIFAGTCMPRGMSWALEEQRRMWVVLCLRRPLQSSASSHGDASRELRTVAHPFAMTVAELCHAAQLSPEAEPYSVQYIHHALARIMGVRALSEGTSSGMSPEHPRGGGIPGGAGKPSDELQKSLHAALQDFSRDPCDGPPGAGEAETKANIDAQKFNQVGVITKQVGLDKTAHLLWWLVCIVEWETEQRLLMSFMAEQSGRTVNLVNEAESTGRSLKTHSIALQAKRGEEEGSMPSDEGDAEARIVAVRQVLDEIDHVRKEAEKLQASIEKETGKGVEEDGKLDFSRILELLRQARPETLEEARAAVRLRQKEASGRVRDIHAAHYSTLEARLLQLHYKGRQALDGEDPSSGQEARSLPQAKSEDLLASPTLPLATYSNSAEAASSLQDHAFLNLLGVPEPSRGSQQSIDRCFQRVEIYERFSTKSCAVEDEFEKLCREAVAEARQRCGGRRLIAELKPLMVDLVKRRQRISSLLNTLRNCGLDQVEKTMLRKHLQPRDLLIALAFSSMAAGASQARMMSLAAKTDSPLPFLFGWARPPVAPGPSGGSGGLSLCMQIQWGALRELFCSPSFPLVLSLGTRGTRGKSYLLQYLYALQECHFRGSTKTPLRIHSMPSVDIIGDFAREQPLRGVVLADVHTYDPDEELCEALVATLANCSALMLLHVSLKKDFIGGGSSMDGQDTEIAAGPLQMAPDLIALLAALSSGAGCPTVIFLLRDVDMDDYGPREHRRLASCVDMLKKSIGGKPHILAWTVTTLTNLGPTELASEIKSLRKSRAMSSAEPTPTLEEALAKAADSKRQFPSMPVLQDRYNAFAAFLRQRRAARERQSLPPAQLPNVSQEVNGPLAQRIFRELDSAGSQEGLLSTLFPITMCHQQLTSISQEKVRCLNRARDYLEPEERRKLESKAEGLDQEIARLRAQRQQAPPHPLLHTFAQLVLIGDLDKIAEFGAYLDVWKQRRRAPLLELKLKWRKELDSLLEGHQEPEDPAATRGRPSDASSGSDRIAHVRTELSKVQHRLDEVDASTDSFWLELMLWYEMERIGTRPGLREIDSRLTFGACKAAYLTWVKNGNPVHFLHSSPLQFGAFDPLRWHPQLAGASLFGSDFIGDLLRELDRDLGVDVRRRPLLVISVIGVQSSGKSTLMNYLFGCCFATHVGRCTKGLYISLLETKRELVVILDTEGLLSVEARDDVFDKQVALMTMACSDLVIVNNRGELGRHVGDLFQVCLFALYHLKLARISPAIGFVLQCLSMVNQQQQYEWVATVKKSLEECVQELQQKEKPHPFKLQDLVFLDSESIFVMPSAFNDDVQFGLQVSRPTNLYAMKALQLREKVFHWIGDAKAWQKQRLHDTGGPADIPDALQLQEGSGTSSFASLSQWYEHARTVWQTLSMCGTDLLQFRTMRQVLMAQQLQEFCDALVQKHVDTKLNKESEALIERCTKELRDAADASDVHTVDNSFRGQLDALRDAVLQEMHHEFDEFVKAHDTKFTDEQVKSDKRFSLMGPMRRKYASVDSLWRSAVHLALEQRSMDHLFEEISSRVNDLLLDQGQNVNVQNVEHVFNEKWDQVMAETQRKQRPNPDKVIQEVIWHFNAALSNLKSQFRKAHIFHGVKSLGVHEIGNDSEVRSSFLYAKKGVGEALMPSMLPRSVSSARSQVDNLWIKLIDAMRLEVDQRGQMSDATALKILNRLNTEMEAGDQLRQLLHQIGSSFVQRIFFETAKATMHYRLQIEQQNFEKRMGEVLGKRQQKLWEIQARVDSGKREVHCAKVWAKKFVDTLDSHFRNAVGKMAQEIVSHLSNIMTNPANACELAIERSFTKRNWRHVVMYAIDPTQYLFMEFHKEWDSFKKGLVDQYCQELKNSFGSCLRIVEEKLQSLLAEGSFEAVPDLTMNKLSEVIREACEELVDEHLASVLCSCLPSFSSDADWQLHNLEQFTKFATVELRRYRANTRKTEQSVERRMETELLRQKADCWKHLCGCPARCPGCGTKCNLEFENHWPDRPHECRRHLYPAFNGWQKQEGRKPFLLHCRAKAQWQIARTRPPLEPYGRERFWDNFQGMLEDEHPDWLDPVTHCPLSSMEPLDDYDEDAPNASEAIQREIEENRRAWANCKDALLEHFTSMADDQDIEWLEKYKREGGALRAEDFPSIRDELFETTPLESMEMIDTTISLEESDVYG